MTISEPDMKAWQLLTDVPEVHNILSYIVLAINVIVPGSGTMLAACIAESHMANKTQIFAGFF